MPPSRDLEPLQSFGKVFWDNQFKTKIPYPDASDLRGLGDKTAIVTGSNSGLGFEATKYLLSLGVSHLVMAVRSLEKGKLAAVRLGSVNNGARIDVWPLDMESYDSIKRFVHMCEKELPRIDYVILNAGVSPLQFCCSKWTGHETTIQVNHISTALLVVLLLPLLESRMRSGAPCRITVVNSITAHFCTFPNRHQRPLLQSFDDINIVPWNPSERYGVSKLLNQLFLVQLADAVDPNKVILNMVDPGLTKGTELAREANGLLRVAYKMFVGICGRPVQRGAATYIHALLNEGKESHGCFLMNNRIGPLANIFYTNEGATVREQIWQETLEEFKVAKIGDTSSVKGDYIFGTKPYI